MTRQKGFTLIEMLLVLVVIAIIIYASIGYIQQRTLQLKIDKTSTQMQQILNAGLSYYVKNGSWPVNGTATNVNSSPLSSYLTNNMESPWQSDYTITTDANNQFLFVYTAIKSIGAATAFATSNIIAGTLPLAYTTSATPDPQAQGASCNHSTTTCYVVSKINIPGQNLNNASAINFAGVYKNGGCVPVPTCPSDTSGKAIMKPQIIVSPIQVSGTYEGDTGSPGNPKVYPISSFTAYTVGPAAIPNGCDGGPPTACAGITTPSSSYWRVCIQVVTEQGEVNSAPSAANWSQYQSLMAITRCSITGEPQGSGFTVHSDQ